MRKLIYPLFFSLLISTTSCDAVSDILDNSGDSLSEAEVISGLKEALEVGADSAANYLAVENGYYGNSLYKILLPAEADIIIDNISKIPGGDALVEKVVLGINRAAESAAKDAGPVFAKAITNMSIADGWEILNGADTSATHYLRTTTNSPLFNVYNPKIQTALDSDLGLGFTANSAWNSLTSQWNTIANSIVGRGLGYAPVNTDLDSYLTQKALNGMYLKIADEEKLIRTDPIARVTDILKKVFGSLD